MPRRTRSSAAFDIDVTASRTVRASIAGPSPGPSTSPTANASTMGRVLESGSGYGAS
jgi:hypothetical protein